MRTALFALLCAASILAAGCGGKKGNEVRITADENGFTPAQVEVAAGQPVTLVFKRTSDATCATEAVFASGERHELPLGQDVRVVVTPAAGDTVRYACGMNMYTGQIIAK